MAKEITMPKLSDSMEEGKVLTWFKKEGDRVTKGEPIAEVETEKADMEVEAFATGILSEIRVQAGQSAPVGEVIAVILSEEEAAAGKAKAEPEKKSAPQKTASEPQPAASGSVAKAEKSKAKERKEEKPAKETPASDRQQTSEKVPTRTTRQAVQREADEKGGSKIAAESDVPTPRRNAVSPLARKLAREHGLDVEGIEGSGPGGRVVSADVRKLLEGTQPEKEEKPAAEDSSEEPKEETKQEAAPARAKESKKEEAAPAVAPASAGGPLEVEHRLKPAPQRLRSVIARRMTESKTTAPHFYVSVEADMTEAARLKAALGKIAPEGQAPGYNAIILKAAALALERHPGVNASWTGDAIEVHDEIHVGFAVEVEGGLLVPVIHNCSRLSLQEITLRARDLTKASRSGKMNAKDFSGGTFTVSNLGMFGIDSFTAIINLPQAAILAVGAVLDKPVVRDGVVTVAPTMVVTLSCDHRVVDGAQAARFLAELKSMLENPLALLVGA